MKKMIKQNLKIAYRPYSNDVNNYIELYERALTELGHEIVSTDEDMREAFYCDAIILNWFENIVSLKFPDLIKIYKFKAKYIEILKKCNTKILFVMNNLRPFDVNKRSEIASLIFKKYIYKNCDKIIMINKASSQFIPKKYLHKASYVPHPNYIGAYNIKDISQENGKSFEILFFGCIRPFKQIEIIIDCAKKLSNMPINFTIAGYPLHESYAQHIVELCKDLKNVTIDIRKIPHDKNAEIFKRCNICLLPFSKKCSLNAGTSMLAFSAGRTIISQDIPFNTTFDEKLMYLYHCRSEKDHKNKMYDRILRAFNDWKNNNEDFCKKGYKLHDIVKKENSLSEVKKNYSIVLNSLF